MVKISPATLDLEIARYAGKEQQSTTHGRDTHAALMELKDLRQAIERNATGRYCACEDVPKMHTLEVLVCNDCAKLAGELDKVDDLPELSAWED